MSAFSQNSCYLKLLTFAGSAVIVLTGIAALAEESPAGAGNKTATRTEAPAPPEPVDDKPPAAPAGDGTATAPVGEGLAPSRSTEPGPVAPAGEGTAPSPATEPAKAPVWHKVQLRITGSMCLACLKEMREELAKCPGVNRLKIDRPQMNYFQPVSPDVTSWANAVILYDSERLPIEYLRGALKQLGYHSHHVVDRLLGHEPDDRDLKI